MQFRTSTSTRRRRALPFAVALAAASACTGRFASLPDSPAGGGGGAGQIPSAGAGGGGGVLSSEAAPARVRRLTASEIVRSASDVFLDGAAVAALPGQSLPHRFDNWFEALSVPVAFADALATLAESVGAQAAARSGLFGTCDPSRDGEATCVRRLVEVRGRRAYRRPLTPEETAGLMKLWTDARALTDFAPAVATVVEAMLQSPAFLFRTELGDPSARPIRRLSGHEVASALSYFLWGTAPDERLLDAAADGSLGREAGVEAEARRLAADERARAPMRSFVMQWLEIPELGTLTRDPKSYPAFGPELAESMTADFVHIVDETLWRAGGLRSLLTASTALVDARLAPVYGLPSAQFATPAKAAPTGRAGVLTSPAFLAAHLPAAGFSPVLLGNVVRRRMLCQKLPEPPADVPSLEPPTPSTTSRERFAKHLNSESCRTCHKLIDPVGFAFERFDGIGQARANEAGVPLTGAGELTGTDVDGAFAGAVELAEKLAQSAEVRRCFVANLLERALGRDAALVPSGLAVDQSSIDAALARVDGTIADLLVAVATSPAFLYRDARNVPGGTP